MSPIPAEPQDLPMRQRLIEQITSCWRTQALHVAVQLDVPDLLHAAPLDAPTVARACGCDVDALRRLLRALCALAICSDCGDDRFGLTAAGALLRREPGVATEGLREMVQWWGGPLWSIWRDLDYSVRTGSSARARQAGRAPYGFLDGSAETAAVFHAAMRAVTSLIAADIARAECWRDARHLVDVGGGHGELAATIAAAHPGLRVTVLDRPDAEDGAIALARKRRLGERFRFVVGDFFDAVPEGADRYVLKSVLHNWDDVACRRIVERCSAAAPSGARLLVVERLRPQRWASTPDDEALARTDLNMLAGLGGRERSLQEFQALLESAGLMVVGTRATCHEFSVIEAVRR